MQISKWLLSLLLFLGASAEARVFDMSKETTAAYFGFTGGPSALGSAAFENEAGTSVTFSDEVKYNYTGEFGFLYSRGPMAFRFGLEILKPQSLSGLSAKNGSTELYTENSDLLGYMPKIGLEFNLQKTNIYRSFIAGSVGYAALTLKNVYTLTSAGSTAYPGMDTTMEAKGTGIMYGLSAGAEVLMTDTTTVVLEGGYRRLSIDNMKYSRSGSYFGSTVSDGDTMQDNGSARKFDLSGFYLGLAFRFYL